MIAAALLAGLLLAAAPARALLYPAPPTVAPGRVPDPLPRPLEEARRRWLQGDDRGVVTALTPWLESRRGPWGRLRTAGNLLLGRAHEALGNDNLANRYYYRVRRTDHPLAPFGAWHEAVVDLRRGRPAVAARECAAYRERWPDGTMADECLVLMGDAWAEMGLRTRSVEAYQEYLELHPDTPREEELRLAIALAVARTSPRRGARLLQELALDHAWPSTDLAVQRALAELARQGIDTSLPDDSRSLMRRALSLRRSGRHDEAWELFRTLARRAADDPEVAAWVEANEDRFAWGTRRYDVFAEAIEARYAAEPSAAAALDAFRAWSRAGEWARALEWGLRGLEEHGDDWRWRRARDDVAWAAMYAGAYDRAEELWADLGRGRGHFARTARFYAGFCALMGGRPERAEERLGEVVAEGRAWTAAALYWRARARDALGRTDEAEADRALASALDATGWYRLLLAPAAPEGAARDGTWPGPPAPRPAVPPALPPAAPGPAPLARADLLAVPAAPAVRWSLLAWGARATAAAAAPGPVPGAPGAFPDAGLHVPDGTAPSPFFDPAAAERALDRFAREHEETWPDLPAARDLALAGLYGEAARIVAAAFDEWREARRGRGPRAGEIRALGLSADDWRPVVFAVHDHADAVRLAAGLADAARTEEERLAAERLAWPIVRGRELWPLARAHDLDPLLVLGIMRQESTYRNRALSPAGAVGLLQVMPATGARIAALLGDARYSPRDLEDPATNLRYGTTYLALLMRRFEGVFPLAVASYNGGPHNVARWLHAEGRQGGTDALVEHIRFEETRDYVKRVAGHYARYVELYGGGDRVVVPPAPRGDHPEIVDF